MAVYSWAIRFSTCDAKACETCKSSDGDIMTAQDAQMWIYGGKEHEACRCNVVYMTEEEFEKWLYNNPNYISCGGSPRD